MKKVYAAEHNLMTQQIRGLLEQEGIECMVKNLDLSGGVGGLPPIECWPEIWVMQDQDYERASAIVNELLQQPPPQGGLWYCRCGEPIEAQFTACWSCGASKSELGV